VRMITRITLAALAALALIPASWARVEAQTTWELGVKGGVAFAKLSGSGLSDTQPFFADLGGGFTGQGSITSGLGDMRTGFMGGGYLIAHVTPQFGVRLEALYASKGTKGDNSGSIAVFDALNVYQGSIDVSGKNTITINYLELPLLAVAYFPSGATGAFEVFAGPAFAFKTSAESKSELTLSANGTSDTQTDTQDITDQVASTDVGGVLGVGYSHKTSSAILSFDVRWTQGFSKVDDTGGADWKNQNLSLMVGVGFPLGGTK
jgi:Outer membrane protein beta-barrel domain